MEPAKDSSVDRFDWIISVAIGLLAVSLLCFALSGHGMGLTQDSSAYLGAARHMAAGDGFVEDSKSDLRPITVWPPGYSIALLPGAVIGFEVWALAIHSVLFLALCVGSYGLLRGRGVTRSAAACAALLVACGNGMLLQYSLLLSEALYLPLNLALVWAAMKCFESPSMRWRLFAGALCAAATLTRYAGLGPSLVLVLLLLFHGRFAPRAWIGALLFIAAAGVPVLLWMARNWLLAESSTGRAFAPHSVDSDWFLDAWRIATTWYFAAPWPRVIRHAATFLLVVLTLVALGRPDERGAVHPLRLALIATSIGYFAMHAAAQFASTVPTSMDLRMQLPLQLCATLAFGGATTVRKPALARACLIALCVVTLICTVRACLAAEEIRERGSWHVWDPNAPPGGPNSYR